MIITQNQLTIIKQPVVLISNFECWSLTLVVYTKRV